VGKKWGKIFSPVTLS